MFSNHLGTSSRTISSRSPESLPLSDSIESSNLAKSKALGRVIGGEAIAQSNTFDDISGHCISSDIDDISGLDFPFDRSAQLRYSPPSFRPSIEEPLVNNRGAPHRGLATPHIIYISEAAASKQASSSQINCEIDLISGAVSMFNTTTNVDSLSLSNFASSANDSSGGTFASNIPSNSQNSVVHGYSRSAPERSSASSDRSIFWRGNDFESPSPSQIPATSRGGIHALLNGDLNSVDAGAVPTARSETSTLGSAGHEFIERISTIEENFPSQRRGDLFQRGAGNADNMVRIDDVDRIEGVNEFRDRSRFGNTQFDRYARSNDRYGERDRYPDVQVDRLNSAPGLTRPNRLRESYGDRFGDRFSDNYRQGMVERSIEWGSERGIEYSRIENRGVRGARGESSEELDRSILRDNNAMVPRDFASGYGDYNGYSTRDADTHEYGYGGPGYGPRSSINPDLPPGTYPFIDADRSMPNFMGNSEPSGFTMFKSLCKEMYKVNWKPKEFFVKFRQHVGKFRLGANVEFRRRVVEEEEREEERIERRAGRAANHNGFPSLWGFEVQNYKVKFTIKPARINPQWKIVCEPQQGDIRFLSRKISVANLFNFQVGVGHDFHYHTTGLKWKISSPIAGINPPQIRHKNTLPVFPGCDMRVGWNADYSFPHLHGSLGTGEPIVGLNLGRLNASVERIETIFTHSH